MMNREEKIELLSNSIKSTKERINEIVDYLKNCIPHNKEHTEYVEGNLEKYKFQLEVFERELQFLKLPQRTIEKLEVKIQRLNYYKNDSVTQEEFYLNINRDELEALTLLSKLLEGKE